MIWVRSIVYFGWLFISTLVYSVIIIVLSRIIAHEKLSPVGNSWGSANMWMLAKICGLMYRVDGLEKLQRGNCIIMSKHQSAWETIALRSFLPCEQSWVLKQELIKIPFFGAALKAFRPIAIDRSLGWRAVKQIVQEGTAALHQGRWVVIFPEGTRVAPGAKKKYGIGGALLAEKSRYPVIPIAHNAGVYWRRRGLKKYPGTIQVVIGEPIDTAGKKAIMINSEVEAWIETMMEKLPSIPACKKDADT